MKDQGKKKGISRRHFVTGLGAVTAGAVAAACSPNSNPLTSAPDADTQQPVTPPSGTVGQKREYQTQIATADCYDYNIDNLRQQLYSMADAIGGLNDIIKPGDTVGIKLNMTGGSGNADRCPDRYGEVATELFWTHPEILRVCMEMIKDAGAGRIIVMEAIYDVKSYKGYGYADVVNSMGAEFVNLNVKDPYTNFARIEVPNPLGENPLEGRTFYYHNQALHELDCFISLPKAKRHYGAGVTHSLKNMVGSIPLDIYGAGAGHRKSMHDGGWPKLVRRFLDICRIRPIHFAINDAIKTADNGEGPWNNGFAPIRHNKLVMGKDPVAVDSISTQVIGWDPMVGDFEGCFASGSLPGNFSGTDNYLRLAQEAGMGARDLDKIELLDATVSTHVSSRHG